MKKDKSKKVQKEIKKGEKIRDYLPKEIREKLRFLKTVNK